MQQEQDLVKVLAVVACPLSEVACAGYSMRTTAACTCLQELNMPQHGIATLACRLWISDCTQAVRSKVVDELHMFDYGTECRSYFGLPRPCNQVVYGQEEPPTYDFSRIKTPLAVFTGARQQQQQQ